ncbi:K02A2.6-like [Cordylochernes scorpioides]|uniref:K02A2.6-like n=1 Tax=Cordylochernes scorpioides TaxID=51811 RepID=A0ABY6KK19_9ARAC|nr:K02A2.6-like [Cordylochernes scorpioides]
MQRMTEVRDEYFADALNNMEPHCEDLVSRLTDAIRGIAVPRAEEALISPFDGSYAASNFIQQLERTSEGPQDDATLQARLRALLKVTKKDKTKRFCVDYRRLNEIIFPDVHPLPLIENILDKLANANIYSRADFSSAYWSIEISPPDRNLLSFVTLEDLNNHINPYPNIIESRKLAIQRTNDRHDKEKIKYENKHKNPHFDTGDLVLVKAYHHPNSGYANKPEMKVPSYTRKANLRRIVLMLLLLSGIEQNPGPKSTRQTTLDVGKERDLHELMAAMSDRIDHWGAKLESRFLGLETGLENINQRLLQLETSLGTMAKSVSANSGKICEIEKRMDLYEMKQRDRNLIFFFGIEGKENESPDESRSLIQKLITDKMQISEEIQIQKCRRLSGKVNSPLLIEINNKMSYKSYGAPKSYNPPVSADGRPEENHQTTKFYMNQRP